MNIGQYRAKIEEAKSVIAEAARDEKNADDPQGQLAALLVGMALDIVGEVFVDVKRIADAVEKIAEQGTSR